MHLRTGQFAILQARGVQRSEPRRAPAPPARSPCAHAEPEDAIAPEASFALVVVLPRSMRTPSRAQYTYRSGCGADCGCASRRHASLRAPSAIAVGRGLSALLTLRPNEQLAYRPPRLRGGLYLVNRRVHTRNPVPRKQGVLPLVAHGILTRVLVRAGSCSCTRSLAHSVGKVC